MPIIYLLICLISEQFSSCLKEPPRPVKKLRLVRKPSSSNSTILYVGLLERQKTSNDALQVLLRISDSLQFQVCLLPMLITYVVFYEPLFVFNFSDTYLKTFVGG